MKKLLEAGPMTIVMVGLTGIVAVVGGVVTIINPETLSFQDYMDNIQKFAYAIAGLGIGRSLVAGLGKIGGNTTVNAAPAGDLSVTTGTNGGNVGETGVLGTEINHGGKVVSGTNIYTSVPQASWPEELPVGDPPEELVDDEDMGVEDDPGVDRALLDEDGIDDLIPAPESAVKPDAPDA